MRVLTRRLRPQKLEPSDMLYAKTQQNPRIQERVKAQVRANEVPTQCRRDKAVHGEGLVWMITWVIQDDGWMLAPFLEVPAFLPSEGDKPGFSWQLRQSLDILL